MGLVRGGCHKAEITLVSNATARVTMVCPVQPWFTTIANSNTFHFHMCSHLNNKLQSHFISDSLVCTNFAACQFAD